MDISRSEEPRTVVPGVIIHQRRPISETSNLVSIIPPAHDNSVFLGVLADPVVRLSEIVDDVLASVGVAGGQYDGRR